MASSKVRVLASADACRRFAGIVSVATEDDVDHLIAKWGVRVRTADLTRELAGLHIDTSRGHQYIVLADWLTPYERCFVKSHEFAHAALRHRGNQLEMSSNGGADQQRARRQEDEAHTFALYLLAGDVTEDDRADVRRFARRIKAPVRFVRRALEAESRLA